MADAQLPRDDAGTHPRRRHLDDLVEEARTYDAHDILRSKVVSLYELVYVQDKERVHEIQTFCGSLMCMVRPLRRMWFGSGRPLMNTPPSWFTRPCPVCMEDKCHIYANLRAVQWLLDRVAY